MSRDEDELRGHFDELAGLVNAARGIAPTGVGSVRVNVSAGGAAVWISTLCAVLGFALFAIMGILYLDHSRKIDRMQDHLGAIYMMAPHLKPEEPEK